MPAKSVLEHTTRFEQSPLHPLSSSGATDIAAATGAAHNTPCNSEFLRYRLPATAIWYQCSWLAPGTGQARHQEAVLRTVSLCTDARCSRHWERESPSERPEGALTEAQLSYANFVQTSPCSVPAQTVIQYLQ